MFVLTSIFFAASYPPGAQLALHAATITAYLGALAVTDTLVLDRVLLVRLLVLSVATSMSSFLAREHGGRLDVASVPGSGSSFTLVLPRRQPVPPATRDPLLEVGGDGPTPA